MEKLEYDLTRIDIKDVYIEITDFCNFQCKHCYRLDRNHPEHKPLEQIKANLELAVRLNAETVIFTGGEPFAHPKFEEIIELAFKYPFKRCVITNGSFSAPTNIEKMDVVNISMEFYGEKQSEYRMFSNLFGKIQKLLTSLEKKVKRNIVTTVFKENRDQYDALIDFAKNNAESIVFSHYVPIQSYPTEYSASEYQKIIEYIKEKVDKFNSSTFEIVFYELFYYVNYPSEGIARNRCKKRLFIQNDNKYSLCPFYSKIYDTLEEVISERHKEPLPLECKTCPHIQTCHGGCPANRLHNNMALDKRDPYCNK
ncbi:MAG: radical SAM protein [Candidatus Lokiarchaeota archaeon]|nr:radical SAM protein [Candidatus Lokiarchaeota archaeon]